MSELEKPSRMIRDCKGDVRKLVNWLPLGMRGSMVLLCGVGYEEVGDRRIAIGSPFSPLFIP